MTHAIIAVVLVMVGLVICAVIAELARSRVVFLVCCAVVGLAGGALLDHLSL